MPDNPAAPDTHDKPRAPGGNNLSNIDESGADRVIPKPGEALDSDNVDKTPDDSGARPKPL